MEHTKKVAMKSIFEEMGGIYLWEGDYCVLNIELQEQEEYQIGKYGQLHQRFLKEYHPARYPSLILEGQLWNHLVEIDKLCKEHMEVMLDTMKIQEGVTEALKVADQMEWVRRMNSIHNWAEEIIMHKLIYEV